MEQLALTIRIVHQELVVAEGLVELLEQVQ
jgi:hypothetical protein